MTKLEETQEEYIGFLEDYLASTSGFLFAHGITPSEEDVKKGEEYREAIRKLKKK